MNKKFSTVTFVFFGLLIILMVGCTKKEVIIPSPPPSSPQPDSLNIPSSFVEYNSDGFNLFTDLSEQEAKVQLQLFEDFKQYFSRNFFDVSDIQDINIILFSTKEAYELYSSSSSPYGYYDISSRTFVSHFQAGIGTFTHEIVHGFLHDKIPQNPEWFNEGLPAFFEKIFGYHDSDGLHIVLGFQNPWRVRSFVDNDLPALNEKPTLTSISKNEFDTTIDRFLAVYLYESGLLNDYIDSLIKTKTKSNSPDLIVEISGRSLTELEIDFSEYLDQVIADALSEESSLDSIPSSFVTQSLEEWQKVDKSKMHLMIRNFH